MSPTLLLIIATLAAGFLGFHLGKRYAFLMVAKAFMVVLDEIKKDGTVELEPEKFLADQREAAYKGWQ